jgi:hypothetical protein
MSGQNNTANNDGLMTAVLLAIIAVALAWGLWRFLGAPFSYAMGEMRLYLFKGLSLFGLNYSEAIYALENPLRYADARKLNIWSIMESGGRPLSLIAVPTLLYCAFRMYAGPIDEKYKGELDIEGLIKEQSRTWTSILPALVENPAEDRTSRWSPALTVHEWLKINKIGVRERGVDEEALRRALEGQLATGWAGFASHQMEPYMRALLAAFVCNGGLQIENKGDPARDHAAWILARLNVNWADEIAACRPRMSPYFAPFTKYGEGSFFDRAKLFLKILINPKETERQRKVLSRRFAHPPRPMNQLILSDVELCKRIDAALHPKPRNNFKNPLEEYKALLARYASAERPSDEEIDRFNFLKAVNFAHALGRRHAFVETALVAMLEWSRKRGGVLASSEWLWLKPTNRNLWYILNNSGRPGMAHHVEAAGAMAHYYRERDVGKPILVPCVESASSTIKGMYG